MQEAMPSEILNQLRNDGRGRHHRAELEKAIAQAEQHLAEIKRMVTNGKKENTSAQSTP